jgi:hypothetical protein
MSKGKPGWREKIWHVLTVNKVARFPGAQGRIPNFIGAEAAAPKGILWDELGDKLNEIPAQQQLAQRRSRP